MGHAPLSFTMSVNSYHTSYIFTLCVGPQKYFSFVAGKPLHLGLEDLTLSKGYYRSLATLYMYSVSLHKKCTKTVVLWHHEKLEDHENEYEKFTKW